MPSHRTTARGFLLIFFVGVLIAAPSAHARTDTQPPPPVGSTKPLPPPPLKPKPKPTPAKNRLIFPVVGPATYTDDYGDPRGQGRHAGNDIMAPRKALAVAAEAGKVKFHTTSWAAGCMLYLYGDSGTTYLYIHLNNDLTAKNDNRGKCVAGTAYAKGLRSGARVAAGEPVGYVGDSGDANGISPHLHFEIHPKGKRDVNPYPYLRAARPLLFTAKPRTEVWVSLQGTVAATSAGVLQLRVDAVRVSTGLRIAKVGRTISLAMPPSALVDALTGLPVTRTGLARVARGKQVTVWTTVAPVTLAAMLGTSGALTADRIQLP